MSVRVTPLRKTLALVGDVVQFLAMLLEMIFTTPKLDDLLHPSVTVIEKCLR